MIQRIIKMIKKQCFRVGKAKDAKDLISFLDSITNQQKCPNPLNKLISADTTTMTIIVVAPPIPLEPLLLPLLPSGSVFLAHLPSGLLHKSSLHVQQVGFVVCTVFLASVNHVSFHFRKVHSCSWPQCPTNAVKEWIWTRAKRPWLFFSKICSFRKCTNIIYLLHKWKQSNLIHPRVY